MAHCQIWSQQWHLHKRMMINDISITYIVPWMIELIIPVVHWVYMVISCNRMQNMSCHLILVQNIQYNITCLDNFIIIVLICWLKHTSAFIMLGNILTLTKIYPILNFTLLPHPKIFMSWRLVGPRIPIMAHFEAQNKFLKKVITGFITAAGIIDSKRENVYTNCDESNISHWFPHTLASRRDKSTNFGSFWR